MLKKITKRDLISLAKWLLGTLIVLLLIIIVLFFLQGREWSELSGLFGPVFSFLFSTPLFYVIWIAPFLLFRFIRHLIRVKKQRGWQAVLRVSLFIFVLPVGILFGAFRGVLWYNQNEDFDYQWITDYENTSGESVGRYEVDGKHRGMHIFLRRSDREAELKEMVKNNVEWITLVPYSYQPDVLKPTLNFGAGGRRIARRDSSFIQTISIAKSLGMEVMMKPHIWVRGEMWRSEIAMDTEEEWDLWFKQYGDFIMHYAAMAERTGCAALCIGTELRESALQKPQKWRELIRQVRNVYQGKIVYAANWDREYKEISFWDELDYIGIQAYFELTNATMPEVKTIKKGWKKTFGELKTYHEKWDKPILFTEIGYKSTMGAADKPWLWESSTASLSNRVSYETQVNCYEALFQTFWEQPWFAGVHLWKWEGDDPFDFTPKNKPAVNIMAKWFGKEVAPID